MTVEEELRTALTGLYKKRTDFNKVTQASHDASRYNQAEVKLTEQVIKQEFETLHQFLRQEEEDRLLVLKEESKKRTGKAEEWMDKMDEMITSLEEKIFLVEKEIDSEGDGIELLEHYEDQMSGSCVGDMQLADVSLMNVPDHLTNLKFAVWKKMKHIAPYIPITMDSRTASQSLKVSSEMNSVRVSPGPPMEGPEQITADVTTVPANHERFHPYSSILGREGFNTGVHCWEVEVTDNSNWTIGIAAQWVSRRMAFEACPEAGLWCISLRDGEYRALTSPSQILNIDSSRPLHRISVRFDWEGGTLDFTNTETSANLFKFNHCFSETVYPYFESIFVGGNLTVSEQTVNISIESDHPNCPNSVIRGEDQERKDDSSLQMGVIISALNGNINGSFTAEKEIEIRSMREEKIKKKKKTMPKNNTAAKTSMRKRFDVTYHVALNRALSHY
ncbi:zinc-binding protein A33-like [Gouania willdenowi]|uniref:zinc-binding protein A33-like n=1 Tax=Gouania willdenowi TaxID=441366 RepID=UPI001056111B|nr:zinc-binding protein A33-like [Gouania willdenowi]